MLFRSRADTVMPSVANVSAMCLFMVCLSLFFADRRRHAANHKGGFITKRESCGVSLAQSGEVRATDRKRAMKGLAQKETLRLCPDRVPHLFCWTLGLSARKLWERWLFAVKVLPSRRWNVCAPRSGRIRRCRGALCRGGCVSGWAGRAPMVASKR